MQMKRILSCLIALLTFCGAAYAEQPSFSINEVREQITAWHKIYETQGRMVSVDILPTVPDVSAMPVLMVVPAYWVPVANEQADWTLTRSAPDAFAACVGDLWQEEHEMTKGRKVKDYSYYIYGPLDCEAAYAPGNMLTIGGLVDIVHRFLNTVDHSHFELDTKHILRARIAGYTDKVTGEQMLPALIHTDCLYTMVHDIPIFGHVIMSVDQCKDEELFYEPCLTALVRDEMNYQIIGSTVRERNILADDVPLCAFDTVLAAIETEIEAGHIHAVYSLDLGYALYNVPNTSRKPGWGWIETAEFYAAPAWRCVCLYTKDAKKELPGDAYDDPYTSLYYKELYINAQTGELLDPNDNRKGCGDYPGVIPWLEAGEEN